MKKIFSKFTRERDVRFQIETSIYLDKGEKFAQKRPLTEAAEPHVAALYENYQYFCEKGVKLFAECQRFENEVRFPFVEGITYYTQLLKAAEEEDRPRFLEILETYKRLAEESCCEFAEFVQEPGFEEVFGSYPKLSGKKACRKLDVDLTFDNLILTHQGENRIIDYEWMFDFLMPLEFVYYRAVLALYVRNGAAMNSFFSEEELFRWFGIGAEEEEIYSRMNEAFNSYTSGGEKALSRTLKKYEKKGYVLSEWVKQSCGVVQVYISRDASFRSSRCLDFEVGQNVDLNVDLAESGECRVIRLDPLNVPGTIHHLRICYREKGEEKELLPSQLRHNAMMVYKGSYVFTGEDPQIIWDIPGEVKPESIHISYGIGEPEDGMALMKTQIEELGEKEKRLSYIEGTKAYKMFLEKKVNTVFGGEN